MRRENLDEKIACTVEEEVNDVNIPQQREEVINPVKKIGTYEKVSYIVGTSALAAFMGLINNYRGDYLNNIIMLTQKTQQILNVVGTILGYLIGFLTTQIIDNFKSKRGKFRPLALFSCIPYVLLSFLLFYTPMDGNSVAGMIYLIGIGLIQGVAGTFVGMTNNVAYVMTPVESERNSLFSTNSFFVSIFTSTSVVLIALLGVFRNKGYYDKITMYYIALTILGVICILGVMNSMIKTKERIPYINKKSSVFTGMKDVLKNKNFWWLTISHQIRNLRLIGTGFGIYVAGCLMGSTDNYVLLALPTGIGTFVGMLIVKKLITKIDPIKVYWIFGIYSLIANAVAFAVGWMYLSYGGTLLQVLFVFFLFTIGIQFGASNIIPNIFNADILNELELQTKGKRLEQTISFTQSMFSTIMSLITGVVTPWVLLTVCGYQQGVDVVQTDETSLKLLFFYTLFAGIFFCVSLVPMLGYKLNAKRRKEVNDALTEQRRKNKEFGLTVEDEGGNILKDLKNKTDKSGDDGGNDNEI